MIDNRLNEEPPEFRVMHNGCVIRYAERGNEWQVYRNGTYVGGSRESLKEARRIADASNQPTTTAPQKT